MGELDDEAVEARLRRLDDMLSRLDSTPGATAALAIDAVRTLTEVYGAALARVVDVASGSPALLEAFTRDELLHHLLVLHDLHPHPLAQRVERALERVRPYLHSHGGEVSLTAIEGTVARVTLAGHCDGCNSAAVTMQTAIRDAVLASAPELDDVLAEPATAPAHPAPVIPLESLLHRPAGEPAPMATLP
jgi:Fe-S cluster biogenesis protein NfuA